MERIWANDIPKHEGQEAVLAGWVGGRRDHGKIAFIDLRDRSGIAQCVLTAKDAKLWQQAEVLRPEWVIRVKGTVNRRPDAMANKETPTGLFEVKVTELEILNPAETPPIATDTAGFEIGEENRLKYRYLDLRRPRLQKNLIRRHETFAFMRNWLSEKGFIEIETPIISKSTPEGARDYLVPARLRKGMFYALPQSPQQYKQLLMAAGLERYYQFARCFRDEDTRGDRQPEFTQLDLEMSFVREEDVMALIEALYIETVRVVFPEKKIKGMPFPRIPYAEAMAKYGTDKPDLRENKDDRDELAFVWITDFPFFEKTDGGGWTFTHNPFSAPKPEHMDDLMAGRNTEGILTTQYDLALNGFEIGGGSIRNHRPEALAKVLGTLGYSEERIAANFGHMLRAFSHGTPPHGGIAMGIDRFLCVALGEPNIRETIAFPKTGDGRDLMMDAPSPVDGSQLDELGLEIKKR